MHASLSAVVCIGLCVLALPAFAQSAPPDDFGRVDAYVTETMRRLPIKGLALAIVRDDQVLYLKGYGIANKNGDPVTPQTPFMLGSVTKTFTALAVQQLMDAGKIQEDKPVQSYIPGFRLADESGGEDVSIRHLLDHTSGITRQEGEAPYLFKAETTFPEALAQLARFAPKYKPGDHYEYSNWNYDLLREVIAQTSGQSYSTYLQQNILDPLDMTHTSLADYHTLPNAATYDLNVFGFPVPYDEPYVPVSIGSGFLSSSAEDMSRYLIAFLNRGQYQGYALLPAHDYGWYDGYWNFRASSPVGARIQFSGSHNSTSSNIQLIPQHRFGVVVLMNTRLDETNPTAPTANDIAANIADMLMGGTYSLPNFTGFYESVIGIDGLLLILIASIVWQVTHLKNWAGQYRAASSARRVTMGAGIILDMLFCAGFLMLPVAFNVSWATMLFMRPDFTIPVLAIGACLGILGVVKAAAGVIRVMKAQ